MKYTFVASQQEHYPLRRLCRSLGISASGYYAWRNRAPSARRQAERFLLARIRQIYQRSRQTYGSPRIYAELRAQGWGGNHKRIERLMRQHQIRAQPRRRFRSTTDSQHRLPVAPNVLQQRFETARANQVWTADLTYVATAEGWLYLATVLDLFSRRIVGWAMAEQLETPLVGEALQMALVQRQPTAGLLHHSDRGRQYASADYQAVLRAAGIQVSMSRRGNCYDNAVHESFFGTLKRECASAPYASRAAARASLFEYIEVWYNRQRRHSALGYLSPAEFENVRSVS